MKTTGAMVMAGTALMMTAGSGADVLIDMPAPPTTPAVWSWSEEEAADANGVAVGTVALARYAHAREPAVATGGGDRPGLVYASRWGGIGFGSGFGSGWGRGVGYRCGGPYYGGYRISISPYTYYGSRGWHGGYVYPCWLP